MGESSPGRGSCKCKGPGACIHLAFKNKRLEWMEQRGQVGVMRGEAGETGRAWKTMGRAWSMPYIGWKPFQGSVLFFENTPQRKT